MRKWSIVVLLSLSACAWWKQNGAAVVQAATTLGCDVAQVTDAGQATVICSGLDAAGNVVTIFTPVVTDAVHAQAITQSFPGTPATRLAFTRAHR